jgi:hypothetical protein
MAVDDSVISRIKRLYASIDAAQEFDMTSLPARVWRDDRHTEVLQDFMGHLSEEDLANLVHAVIYNIANLQDHLRRWAACNGQDKTKVDATFTGSRALQIIKDLSNNDRHGYPPRGRTNSGLAPRLTELGRVMQMTTKERAGSSVVMTLGPDGMPKVSGSGTARAVITGNVVDKDGNNLGDLLEIEQQAVQAWEALLEDFGVTLDTIPPRKQDLPLGIPPDRQGDE